MRAAAAQTCLMSSRPGHPSARSSARRAWEQRAVDEAFNLIEILEALPSPSTTAPDDPELNRLYDEDQADRAGGVLADGSSERDRDRRLRGLAKLHAGEVRTARDFFCLAMLLQHGLAEHYHLGHELARRAWAAGYQPAGWLSAAALDRWLMNAGLPQKYGTQYVFSEDRWRLYRVDPATTDEDRARYDVPSLAKAQERAEAMTRDGY